MKITKLLNSLNNLSTTDIKFPDIPVSRREILNKAGDKGIKAIMASLPVMFGLSVLSRTASAQSGQTVIDTLNFALTLEYLEAQFYVQGLAAGGLIPASDRPVFLQIGKHETAHVTVLRQTIQDLNGTPIAQPLFDFTAGGTYPNVFTDYATFLTISQAFEDTGVRAYKGQAGNLMGNSAVLTAALQIHSVEARHASEVRRIRGQKGWIVNAESGGAPAAIYNGENNTTQAGVNILTYVSGTAASESFDEPLSKTDVVAIVTPFIVG